MTELELDKLTEKSNPVALTTSLLSAISIPIKLPAALDLPRERTRITPDIVPIISRVRPRQRLLTCQQLSVNGRKSTRCGHTGRCSQPSAVRPQRPLAV